MISVGLNLPPLLAFIQKIEWKFCPFLPQEVILGYSKGRSVYDGIPTQLPSLKKRKCKCTWGDLCQNIPSGNFLRIAPLPSAWHIYFGTNYKIPSFQKNKVQEMCYLDFGNMLRRVTTFILCLQAEFRTVEWCHERNGRKKNKRQIVLLISMFNSSHSLRESGAAIHPSIQARKLYHQTSVFSFFLSPTSNLSPDCVRSVS